MFAFLLDSGIADPDVHRTYAWDASTHYVEGGAIEGDIVYEVSCHAGGTNANEDNIVGVVTNVAQWSTKVEAGSAECYVRTFTTNGNYSAWSSVLSDSLRRVAIRFSF